MDLVEDIIERILIGILAPVIVIVWVTASLWVIGSRLLADDESLRHQAITVYPGECEPLREETNLVCCESLGPPLKEID